MAGYTYATSTNNEIVPTGGSVKLWYPPADAASGHVNQSEADVVVGGTVLARDKVDVEFDEASETITVTNGTGADWPPQTDIVVAVPSDLNLAGVEAIVGTILDHEARLDAIEGVERRVSDVLDGDDRAGFSGDDKVKHRDMGRGHGHADDKHDGKKGKGKN